MIMNDTIKRFRKKFVTNVFGFPKAEDLEAFLTEEIERAEKRGEEKMLKKVLDLRFERVFHAGLERGVIEFSELAELTHSGEKV